MKYFYFFIFIVVGCSTGPRQPTMFMTLESEEETAPPMRIVETPRSQGNSPQQLQRTQSTQPESPGNSGQLPSCPGALQREMDVGTVKLSSGGEYVGELKDGQANGQGIEYGADGSVLDQEFGRTGILDCPEVASAFSAEWGLNPARQTVRGEMADTFLGGLLRSLNR